jgi:hypothetical protein
MRKHLLSGNYDRLAEGHASHAGSLESSDGLVPLAQAAVGSVLSATVDDASSAGISVSLALGAANGDLGAAFSIAGLAGRSGDTRTVQAKDKLRVCKSGKTLTLMNSPVFGTHARTFTALGASRESTLASLGPMRDADAALNDAVLAPGNGAGTLVSLKISYDDGNAGWHSVDRHAGWKEMR